MYDTIILDFEYSDNGNDFDILSKVYLEYNSILIDRQYKNSKDAIATQRIRYPDISDVELNGDCIIITYSKGSVYLKNKDSDAIQNFYNKLVEIKDN